MNIKKYEEYFKNLMYYPNSERCFNELHKESLETLKDSGKFGGFNKKGFLTKIEDFYFSMGYDNSKIIFDDLYIGIDKNNYSSLVKLERVIFGRGGDKIKDFFRKIPSKLIITQNNKLTKVFHYSKF
jgi:hypothetical protein